MHSKLKLNPRYKLLILMIAFWLLTSLSTVQADIIKESDTLTHTVYFSPHATFIPTGTNITLKTGEDNAKIYYTIDGSDPAEHGELYTGPIRVDADVTIKAIAQTDELTSSVVTAHTYTVYDAQDVTRIHHIQGEGHESPMLNHLVRDIEGIVTYKYTSHDDHFFHLQTPEEHYDGKSNTSEGIVVHTEQADDVDVGDLVEVTGTVEEYNTNRRDGRNETDLSITQINALHDHGGKIVVKETGVDLPKPVKITSSHIPEKIIGETGFDEFNPKKYALDFWKSIEGMRVVIAPSKAIGPRQHGNLVVVTEEYETNTVNGGLRLTKDGPSTQTIQYKLFPNEPTQDFTVKTGDKFTEPITGVVNYEHFRYKVYADLNDLKTVLEPSEIKPEKTNITKDDDKLTIASYNMENFSGNLAKTADIARAFVSDMDSPDIIGLTGIHEHQKQESKEEDMPENYLRLIEEIKAAGGPTYDYINLDSKYSTDRDFPGNTQIGFLYNGQRVSLVESKEDISEALQDIVYENEQLTLNPGHIAPNNDVFQETPPPLATQFEFQDENILVIATQLNSKSEDDPVFGKIQPPIKRSESKRTEMAQIINDFVKDIEADNPTENVVVLGNMNDVEFSAPLQVLQGAELTNIIEKVPAEKRYTYIDQENSQVFDHILISNHLANVTKVDIPHINADFTEEHGRTSAHDPVLAQIDLRGESETEPDENDDGENEAEDEGEFEDLEETEEQEKPEDQEEPEDQEKSEEEPGTDEQDNPNDVENPSDSETPIDSEDPQEPNSDSENPTDSEYPSDPENPPEPNDPGDSQDPGTPEEPNNPHNPNTSNVSNEKQSKVPNEDVTSGGANNSRNDYNDEIIFGSDDTSGKSGKSGLKLPKTATQMYTFLLIGSLLFITGSLMTIYRRKTYHTK